MERLSRIIEQIYSAALDPVLWTTTVRALREEFDCASAGLYVEDLKRNKLDLVHLCGVDPAYVRVYIAQYVQRNPWSDAPELQAAGKVRTEHSLDEYYRREGFYRRTPYFNEWMKPQDFVHTLGINLTADRRARTKLFLYRAGRAGPFSRTEIERFECVSVHLMNAVKVADRLGQHEARAAHALDLLERLDVGVAFIDDDGRVLEANAFAQDVFAKGDGLRIEGGRLVAAHRNDAAKLKPLIRSALELHIGQSFEVPAAIQLRAGSGTNPSAARTGGGTAAGRALQLRVIPLPSRGGHSFCGRRAAAMLVIADRERDSVVSAEDLQRLYGLTGAEARLVQWLLCGIPLRQASELMHVTYETARGYLKNVFLKTGVGRQTELVRRLLNDRAMLN
jgi:DNA-binding CsgD family transcriptional regulator